MKPAHMPLPDWLDRLETLHPAEMELGLDRITRVLERLDLDYTADVLHVAGTNGKGSSVAMLDAILRGAGVRTGCYTSPHVIDYNERIAVDGASASDAQIVAAFERVDAARQDEALTYFEFGTLAALVVFVEAEVDAMILEIGMGGRLDAVNAIEPTAGLITNISLDHCDWLGNDIEAIAFEKAGIMRAGKPAVFGSRDAPATILQRADDVGAELVLAGRDFDWQADGDTWHWRGREQRLDALARPALVGDHQLGNAAGVLALLEAAGKDFALDADLVSRALHGLELDGRMQVIDRKARWILDVAHNEAAAAVLGKTLATIENGGTTLAIVGMLGDKDVEGLVMAIAPEVDRWIAVTAESPRAIEADELARRIANATDSGCLVAASLDDAIAEAEGATKRSDRVLVTGSFYLVGPALKRLYSRRES